MTQSSAERLLKPEILGRVALLSSLTESELASVAVHMRVKRYAKREMVVVKGSMSDALLFLLAGNLQVVDYTADGKEIGLNLIAPGTFFGELALIDGLPRSASVVAFEPSAVAFLPRQISLDLIYGKPAIAEQMLKHFARSIRSLTVFRSLLAIPNTHQRLYALLCHLKQPDQKGQAVITDLPTQRQIAIMINTSRETVSRALAELEQAGILHKGKRVLVIHNPQALERMSKSTEA